MLGRRAHRRFLAQHPRPDPTPATPAPAPTAPLRPPGYLVDRGAWSEAPRVGDARIRAEQDKAHRAAIAAQHLSEQAAARRERQAVAARQRMLTPSQDVDRLVRFRLRTRQDPPDCDRTLQFSCRGGHRVARTAQRTWPDSIAGWRDYLDHATHSARWDRLLQWHSWSNADMIRSADRFQALRANDADAGSTPQVCAFAAEGVRCGLTGWRRGSPDGPGSVRCLHHRLAERAAQPAVCGATPDPDAAAAASGVQCRRFHCELCGCAGNDAPTEWYSVGRWLVVCAQCVDRTSVCPPPEGVCGGGCGSSRTDTLTADGSRGCRPCAGEMPVHTVWLARALRQLPLALAWVAQSLPEETPALLPSEKMALCVEMASQWCAAATAALPPPLGTSTAPPAVPGNPTPWSLWWAPTRRALQLPPSTDGLPRWPQCVGGAPRPAAQVLPDLWQAPAPVMPFTAPPRPRPRSLTRAGASRAKRGRGAGTDASRPSGLVVAYHYFGR